MSVLILPTKYPIDLRLTLKSGQSFRWIEKEDAFEGVLGNDIFYLRNNGDSVEVASSLLDDQKVVEQLSSYFRLNDNWKEILGTIGIDGCLSLALHRYRGLRLLRQDPWETLVTFAISSVSNISKISHCIEGLCQSFGSKVRFDGSLRYSFPSAEVLARSSEQELRSVGLGFRARFVKEIAQCVAETKFDVGSLRSYSYEQARDWLMALPGVGPKVSDCTMLYGLDKLESFPVDRWIKRGLERWYSDQVTSWTKDPHGWAFDHFGKYAGYAQLYLFHYTRVNFKDLN